MIKEVLVKANKNNSFNEFTVLPIKLDFTDRNEPNMGLFRLNEEFYNAHVWTTKDGIFESYNNVIKEALENGYNEDNKDLIEFIKGL